MIDFREDIEKFWDKYSWVVLLLATLYFVGHGVVYLIRRVLW